MKKGGLFLIKKEMTRLWVDNELTTITLLAFPYQQVLRQKDQSKDGYDALILGVAKKKPEGEIKQKDFDVVSEFRLDAASDQTPGMVLSADLLKVGEHVHVRGTSKGKGYQGAVKRFHLAGGPETHGSKFHKHIGSMGNRKPRRVQKGHPHAGHMGTEQITIKNVKIQDMFTVEGATYVALKGSVPGARNGLVKVYFA